jgi:hypothetical protein
MTRLSLHPSLLPVTSYIVNSAATYFMVVKFRNTSWPPPPQLSLHRRAALSSNSNGTRSVYNRENPKSSLHILWDVYSQPPHFVMAASYLLTHPSLSLCFLLKKLRSKESDCLAWLEWDSLKIPHAYPPPSPIPGQLYFTALPSPLSICTFKPLLSDVGSSVS